MNSTRYEGPIRQAQVFPHGLVKAGFAADDRLAEVLDRYPADLIDINLYDYQADGGHTLKTGARGALSGADLLKAIQQGKLWVNLRDIQDGWPELWAAAMDEFGRIQDALPGLRAVRNAGQLILSSPKSGAPYHFDNAGVVLFHMRGKKRVFVYPGDEAHLPEASMEQVVALQTTEEIPYRPDFEANATVVDLEPGQALTWPIYAPHRVRNLDRFCVSLSMDFQTWGSRFRNGALFTNAVLRERGGRPRPTDRMSRPELAARWAAAVALKKAGVMKSRIHDLERDFEPDAEAADGARAI